MQVYRETLELTTEIGENETLLPQINNIVEPISLPVTNETSEVTKCEPPNQEKNNRPVPVKGRRAMTDSDKFRWSQILVKTVFPVIVLLFMSIYWIIGLCLYYKPNI